MPHRARSLHYDGHSYELLALDDAQTWHLFEDLDEEAALVGTITLRGSQFAIECYWRPGMGRHDIDAATVDSAAVALIASASAADAQEPSHP
ncbi:hypothetical protein [Leifsonia sp. RAF41]|uniref:hypothetical protein n=1 Tax=Leifsonia sp. RAF41 TaxID=3233056 RepID=UPI003F997360